MNNAADERSSREGRLRNRLLAAFLLLSLVPLFGSNAIGYFRSRVIVEQLVTRYLDGMADLQAAHVQGRVEQRLLYLSAIGNGNRFLEAAAGSEAGTEDPEMSTVATPEAVRDYLKRKRIESGRFGALALFSPDGSLLASTDESHPVNQWSTYGATPVAVLRSPEPDVTPTLRLTVPVERGGGAVAAYLVATIPLGQGNEFLEVPRHVAGSVESFIVDDQGRPVFVSHPHGSIDYRAAMESPLLDMPPGQHARYRSDDGVDVIGASAALPAYGWRFLAEAPVTDALGELAALRNLSLMLGSLFAVLVLAAGWLLAGGIVAPVRRLLGAVRALGAGALDVRVPAPGRDEIGELSEAFNEMAAELKAKQERLDLLHRREIERAQQLATVGELASGVAHEIKNPLVGISNGLDLVLRRVEDPGLEPITTEMKRQLVRIETAVRDLLAFARPASPEVARVDLNHVVERALALVRPAAAKRGVELATQLAEGLPPVTVDAELVRQSVVNLVMNAVQMSPETGRVRVSTGLGEGQVYVRVDDDGPGLSPEERELIFKPFYTTRHSGTGLGLSITRGIIEQHGGVVEVESTPGQGARFTVRLPLDEAAEDGNPRGDDTRGGA